MNNHAKWIRLRIAGVRWATASATFGLAVLWCGALHAFTLNVVSSDQTPVAGFRYLIEEDTSYPVNLGQPDPASLGVNIGRSHAPVITAGRTATNPVAITFERDPAKTYMVSVMPDSGFTMSGALLRPGRESLAVIVNPYPVATAQISVYVFEDNQPINGAPDIPAESPLAGFSIIVFDERGQVSQDAFGSPLGTMYQQNPDGSFVLDADGMPVIDMMGNGAILTDLNGEALIKYMPPNKYGIRAVPPSGDRSWVQTATIEGTPGIDTWVKAGEPPYFAEWGFFSWHAFIGFVHPMELPPDPAGSGTITGQVVYAHDNHPPQQPGLNPGKPVSECWIGLNDLGGADQEIYAQPCDADGYFTIENVPPGSYQLVVWDEPLDAIIDFRTVDVPAEGGVIDLDKIAVFAWFGWFKGSVFNDVNENGFRDEGELGISNQTVSIRFPDGSGYQSTVTDPDGNYALTEVFPFFHWMVAAVDNSRYKPTGASIWVDDGGPVEPGQEMNPQLQPENNGLPFRTEVGSVLRQAMILYGGETNVIDWGKSVYSDTGNGGISGVIYYDTTRAEDDPRYSTGEPWQPGIPGVTLNLYADENHDDEPDGAPIDTVTSDSWDQSMPTRCVGAAQIVNGQPVPDCGETLSTWNQVRPGKFDGGYSFRDVRPGRYIVETVLPTGYEVGKEEDKNVMFGDSYTPSPLLLPPRCVGEAGIVPDEVTLFPGEPTANAGQPRRLCDRKAILVQPGQNSLADFFLFTEVPKAGRIWGLAFNDFMLEFNPSTPNSGGNLGVSWLPIAIKDMNGNELVRTYTDEWGRYNAVVPSTFSVNIPTPTGVSPSMLTVCLNDPGPIEDPDNPGQYIMDPWYHAGYDQVCNVFNFYPGRTTSLDTPILPIAAFSGNHTPLDCEFPNGTPLLRAVNGPTGGPYVSGTQQWISIGAVGPMSVPNAAYDPTDPASRPMIIRDYGFGDDVGRVTITLPNGTVVNVTRLQWSPTVIRAYLPTSARTGQLTVVRANNRATPVGITLTVGGPAPIRVAPGQSIQAAIDAAPTTGAPLILVASGVYRENLIFWKEVKLQGTGAFSTQIQAGPRTPPETTAWQAKLADLIAAGQIDLIPGERPDFYLEQGAGIMVATTSNRFHAGGPRIDGFTVFGATQGGGIFVNAYGHNLEIGNNRLISNQGSFGGGIRVGTPSLVNDQGTGYLSNRNENIRVHHNHIDQNGAIDGGGGLAIFNGADNYNISDNYVCGNFSFLYGGGIAHHGLSNNGMLFRNQIVSNQSADEGGGVIFAGELVPAAAPAGTLTEGAGSVTVNDNLIQGNLGGDDGGGIRTLMFNGQDVVRNPGNSSRWYSMLVINNLIVNNVSADAGGGIALDDTVRSFIINNTIANNDSTATSPDAFGPCIVNLPIGQVCAAEATGGYTRSVPQPAGISSRGHSAGLLAVLGPNRPDFSNPVLVNDIIWHNRSFYWDPDFNNGFGGLRSIDTLPGATSPYWDMAVYQTPTPELLSPSYCLLSAIGPYNPATNVVGDPSFVGPYLNVFQATAKGAALGNFVSVTFKPNGIWGNYHILRTSLAFNRGTPLYLGIFPLLFRDYDGANRPNLGRVDIGADEL